MERGRCRGWGRAVLAGVLIAAELAGMLALLALMRTQAARLYVLVQMASGVTLLWLMGGSEGSAYRTAWMSCALVLGAAGVGLYLLFGRRHGSRLARLSRENVRRAQAMLGDRGGTRADGQAARFLAACGFPAYPVQPCRYFALGEHFLQALMEDIERARVSVEMEFFILSPGEIMDKLLNICEKAHERGVVIRLLIDDVGTLTELDRRACERIRRAGIELRRYNPVMRHAPLLTLNFRDHRKIAVIDGQIAYTGGINLADEYANLRERYGHWKDTGVRLTGAAAGGMQAFFEAMWAASEGRRLGALPTPAAQAQTETDDWAQPYLSGPQGAGPSVALALYRLLIAGARESVWITTPYLLLDEALESALCMAAKSGVDVRIVLPGVPDHRWVALAGEAHFPALLRSGVKLYRYSMGFVHAKMCICDARVASIGTVNLDFRSLYLHFEDGVLLGGAGNIAEMRADMETLMARCERLSVEKACTASAARRMARAVLRALAPLL
jgi:cardiolipin synthase